MTNHDLNRSLPTLFSELVYGAPEAGAFVLNAGDAGLLSVLDQLSAADASEPGSSGSTVAAHVDHLRYGLSLLNRWAEGDNPFADADWTASWERKAVSEAEWSKLRSDFRAEVDRWHSRLREPRSVIGAELDGMIASVVHLAYHLGAIRQIQAGARGPRATDYA